MEYFGGMPTPTSEFWCTIAASADVMFSALCWTVLAYPTNVELRKSVLWVNALYALFHFGGFLRAHYMFEPHPHGTSFYICGLISTWAAYLAWGRK